MEFGNWICAAIRKIGRHSAFAGVCALVLLAAAGTSRADGPASAPFDLAGPGIRVKVTRNGETLPIGSVASLRAGDKLWVQPDFPSDESAHYLLVAAFLEGPTNPPPDGWFTRVETWQKEAREKGTVIAVPDGAQQALLFLAPDTGGAFGTLRSTIRGNPGIFVRASEYLEQASLDRTRLDKFLEEIRAGSSSVPLAQRAALLSQTLAVKADPECFAKPVDQQSACLTQDTSRLTLQGEPNQSLVETLTTGASADLVGTLGVSPLAKSGYYSPYIGSAMDMVRLLNGLRTTLFQYLPAMVEPVQDELNLKLNAPPSFRSPRSVLVVALPSVQPAGLPLLRLVDPKQEYCLQNDGLVLRAEGAPLVFSTRIAHDFVLNLQNKFGQPIRVPAVADAARGGFTVDVRGLKPDQVDTEVTGTLEGAWGFDPYQGPSFRFQSAHPAKWTVPPAEAGSLLVGRESANTLHLEAGDAACVENVTAQDTRKKDVKIKWKAASAEELEVDLPLKDQEAGSVTLAVKQFGLAAPDLVALHTYAAAANLEGFAIHAGDAQGVLTGTHLDQVSGFDLNGIRFAPGQLTQAGHLDSLSLLAQGAAATAALLPGHAVVAHVALKDGRVLDLQTDVRPPRPKVVLVSKSVEPAAAPSAFHLGNEDELPQDGRLSFLLKTEVPEKFPHTERIEVATSDDSSSAFLSVEKGGLVLQDSESVLATLDPLKDLGSSAFGPLRFRPVDDQDEKGDWQPLAKLVRIPSLKDVRCPAAPDKPCVLSGTNLFLLDSVSADPDFTSPVAVAPGYADATLSVPRPSGTLLYVKLRDDPSVVNTVALPVFPDTY